MFFKNDSKEWGIFEEQHEEENSASEENVANS